MLWLRIKGFAFTHFFHFLGLSNGVLISFVFTYRACLVLVWLDSNNKKNVSIVSKK